MSTDKPTDLGAKETAQPEKPTKERADALKEGFSQACQMYRHFVVMRYYTFAIFGAITAALATLHFQLLANVADPKWASIWIRFCGFVSAIACGVFDYRLTELMYHYEHKIPLLAKDMNLEHFEVPPKTSDWMRPLRFASIVAFAIAALAWIVFADAPIPVAKK